MVCPHIVIKGVLCLCELWEFHQHGLQWRVRQINCLVIAGHTLDFMGVESQTNVDPTLGPVMYVVTFEFSYGGRVNGRGKNYKLGCDVLFKCTCECYKHHTNSANISKRSVLSTFPRSSKIFKLWLFSFAISIRWWIIFVSNTRTMK